MRLFALRAARACTALAFLCAAACDDATLPPCPASPGATADGSTPPAADAGLVVDASFGADATIGVDAGADATLPADGGADASDAAVDAAAISLAASILGADLVPELELEADLFPPSDSSFPADLLAPR